MSEVFGLVFGRSSSSLIGYFCLILSDVPMTMLDGPFFELKVKW